MSQFLPAQGVKTLGGVPDGMTALVLNRLLAESSLLHICVDEAQVERLQACLAHFVPQAEVIYFPPWDCLPYDRVSPSPQVVSARLAALFQLLQPAKGPRICLTTVAALLTKVMPRAQLQKAGYLIKAGTQTDPEKLQAYLAHNGYQRVDTVREAGEFARRGGLFDLFPPGREQPVRLDFFGDTLESMRAFDAATQRTIEPVKELRLLPVAEYVLDDESIGHFRQEYREAFGAVIDDDPLYAAVSEGRRHAGMEH